MERVLVLYLTAVNILAFVLYGVDKRRARNREWRISEKTLIGIAAILRRIAEIIDAEMISDRDDHGRRYGMQ